jgi:hypothetical protein
MVVELLLINAGIIINAGIMQTEPIRQGNVRKAAGPQKNGCPGTGQPHMKKTNKF